MLRGEIAARRASDAERSGPGGPIYGPPGYDFRRLLALVDSASVQHSSQTRKALCERSPILFALIYLPHLLRSEATRGRTSLSDLHLAIAEAAKICMRRDLDIAEARYAWIAPRYGAKSTWVSQIIPLWALAFGHRKFALVVSDGGRVARKHLAAVVEELQNNARLRADFPDLCAPVTSNSELYVARSGAIYSAAGIDASVNGLKIGTRRMDYLSLDDIEPKAANYDSTTKAKRLSAIETIFPMNDNAVVMWAATTTVHGGLAHDLVKAALGGEVAEWVAAERFRVHYFPAIIVGPDGSERSLWPQRWPLAELQTTRATRKRVWARDYNNLPMAAEKGAFWQSEHFVYEPTFRAHTGILSIDPAVTNRATSDYSGFAVVGVNQAKTRCCVMDAQQVKLSPAGIGAKMEQILRRNRWIDTVLLEDNQGKATWPTILKPRLPAHVELKTYGSSVSKPVRYADALELWEEGKVSLLGPLPAFEEQALAYPEVAHDDVLDAVVAPVLHYLGDRAA